GGTRRARIYFPPQSSGLGRAGRKRACRVYRGRATRNVLASLHLGRRGGDREAEATPRDDGRATRTSRAQYLARFDAENSSLWAFPSCAAPSAPDGAGGYDYQPLSH